MGSKTSVGTWLAIGGLAVTLAGVVFSAGDARQQLVGNTATIQRNDGRITKLEGDVSEMRASLARIEQYSRDTRDTTHRLERGHVYARVED